MQYSTLKKEIEIIFENQAFLAKEEEKITENKYYRIPSVSYYSQYKDLELRLSDLSDILTQFEKDSSFSKLHSDMELLREKIQVEKVKQDNQHEKLIQEKAALHEESLKSKNKVIYAINHYLSKDISNLFVCSLSFSKYSEMTVQEQDHFVSFFKENNIGMIKTDKKIVFNYYDNPSNHKNDVRNDLKDYIKNKSNNDNVSLVLENLKSFIYKEEFDPFKLIKSNLKGLISDSETEHFLKSFK